MVGFSFVPSVLTFLLFAVPGVLMSFAVLFKSSFSRFEKAFFGVFFAAFVPPFLGVVEKLLGINFSAGLVLFNLLLMSLASIVLWSYFKGFKFGLKFSIPKLTFSEDSFNQFLLKNWASILLAILVIATFYIRIATSFAPNFFEFDPYFYDHITEHLVKDGFIPPWTDEVYYPELKSHVVPPFIAYMAGGWNLLYNLLAGIPFDKGLLVGFNQLYPPVVSVLMVFFAFLLVREIFKNELLALVASSLFAFTPQLLTKTAAGVSELQPLGLAIPVILLSLYSLALLRKDLVLSCLVLFVAFISAFGTNTYIWIFSVFGVYLIVQSFLDFFTGNLDRFKVFLNVAFGIFGFVGLLVFSFFWGAPFNLQTSGLILLSGAVLYVLLFGLGFASKFGIKLSKGQLVLACIGLVLLLSIATPIGSKLVGFVNSVAGFSFTGSPLGKTVQEENPTNEGFFESSFGAFGWIKRDASGNPVSYKDENGNNRVSFILSPPILLLLLALVLGLISVFVLYSSGLFWQAGVFGIFTLFLTLFNSLLDSIFGPVISSLFAGQDSLIAFVLNDVFIFMFLAILSGIIIFLYSSGHRNSLLLLLIIAVFPVSFVGLNKLKYMVFLAVALCIAFPLFVGQLTVLFEILNKRFSFLSEKRVGLAVFLAVLLLSVPIVGYQFSTVKNSMDQLQATRMPQDWVDALGWMKINLKDSDRVISWWDYGHWTVFFAEKKSVTDPGNNYPELNQEVAHAFVAGPREELIATMKRHGATVVMLDAELIPKWGALNYLQSTWNNSLNNFNPCNNEWEKGPGASRCEAEHMYEFLTIGQQCQNTLIPMIELQSNLGLRWCVPVKDNQIGDKMYLQTRDGLLLEKPRNVLIFSNELKNSNASSLANASILIPYQQGTLLNINPDFSVAGLSNKYFKSNYAQLFFFEKLRGFEIIYSSPNGQVKLFRLNG